jgi:hypothetical protein
VAGELGWSLDTSLAIADLVRIGDGDVVQFCSGLTSGGTK